jgi:hypothetical protein
LNAPDSLLFDGDILPNRFELMMPGYRILAVCAALICLPQPVVRAAEVSTCLDKEQRQAVQASGKVIPLASAKRAIPAHKREVVRARLCQRPSGLVYLLTLLARDGKVTVVAVDASSGRLAGGR